MHLHKQNQVDIIAKEYKFARVLEMLQNDGKIFNFKDEKLKIGGDFDHA
jgi:hypothetical protein